MQCCTRKKMQGCSTERQKKVEENNAFSYNQCIAFRKKLCRSHKTVAAFIKVVLFQQYVFNSVLFSTLSISSVLTVVIWLTQSFRFWGMIATKGVSFLEFFSFFLFLFPTVLLFSLPAGFVLALVWFFFHLNSDHEREVIASCGVNNLFFLWPSVRLGALVSIVLYVLSLVVLPESFKIMKHKEMKIRNSFTTSLLVPEQFTRIGKRVVYVQKQCEDGSFEGILIQDDKNPQKQKTVMGQKARTIQTDHGLHILIQNGIYQEIPKRSDRKPFSLSFKEHIVDFQDVKEKERSSLHGKSLLDLAFPQNAITDLQKKLYFNEIQQRLVVPFLPLTYAALVTLILLYVPSRKSRRWLPALLAIILAFMCQGMVMMGFYPTMPSFFSYLAYASLVMPFMAWMMMLVREREWPMFLRKEREDLKS